jgi:hypothetical protein
MVHLCNPLSSSRHLTHARHVSPNPPPPQYSLTVVPATSRESLVYFTLYFLRSIASQNKEKEDVSNVSGSVNVVKTERKNI